MKLSEAELATIRDIAAQHGIDEKVHLWPGDQDLFIAGKRAGLEAAESVCASEIELLLARGSSFDIDRAGYIGQCLVNIRALIGVDRVQE